MLAWKAADSSRQFANKKALRIAYRRDMKAKKVHSLNLDDGGDATDNCTDEDSADEKRRMQAAHILDTLLIEKQPTNKPGTTASAS